MSANDIVVIKKEDDGKFRGYRRGYDAYCEGEYDYEGPCQYCESGCDMCDGKGHHTPLESVPIFEVDTIEGAVHAYDKWCEESGFCPEYGYVFEGLEPNAETIEAMKETDLIIVKGNLKFILDRIVNTSNNGFVLVNDCSPEEISKKVGEALDLLNNPMMQIANEVESVEELLEELHKPDDIELLDFLQQELNKSAYTGKVVCRDSTTNRGWRLHETSREGAVSDVRQAIINYMEQVKKKEE